VSSTAQLYPEDPRVDLQTDAVLTLPGDTQAKVSATFIDTDYQAAGLQPR
jgi:hypothetical protein